MGSLPWQKLADCRMRLFAGRLGIQRIVSGSQTEEWYDVRIV